MKKFLALLLLLPSLAFAQAPLLAYDVSPPDNQCPGGPRNCYMPAIDSGWGPVNPAVGGPAVTQAFVTFTLAEPQWIEATFDTGFFLAPNPKNTGGGEYTPGIGIDGFDAAHLCNQFQGGLTNDNVGSNLSLHSRAVCLIQLPAGTHTIYAMENAQRATVYSYRGVNNQALIVRFY